MQFVIPCRTSQNAENTRSLSLLTLLRDGGNEAFHFIAYLLNKYLALLAGLLQHKNKNTHKRVWNATGARVLDPVFDVHTKLKYLQMFSQFMQPANIRILLVAVSRWKNKTLFTLECNFATLMIVIYSNILEVFDEKIFHLILMSKSSLSR